MSEFTPAQLDALEDALENLEAQIPPRLLESGDEGDAEAVIRLDQFRQILSLSREALSMEDVPAGLLDDVFAQARASTEADAAVVAPTPTQTPPWWKRLRTALLVPAVAVAGSTVLILWMVTPKSDSHNEIARADAAAEKTAAAPPAEPAGAAEQVADSRLADAAARADGERNEDPFGQSIGRAGGLAEPPEGASDLSRGRLLERPAAGPVPADDAEQAEPEPEEEKEEDRSDADDTVVYDEGAPRRRPAAPSSTPSTKSPLEPPRKSEPSPSPASPISPAPTPSSDAPQPKSETRSKSKGSGAKPGSTETDDPWKTLSRADGARRAGGCSKARPLYREVQSTADDRKARARALAGLGVCEELAGNGAQAESYYRQARALDAGVSSYIAAERPRDQAAPPQATSKKK